MAVPDSDRVEPARYLAIETEADMVGLPERCMPLIPKYRGLLVPPFYRLYIDLDQAGKYSGRIAGLDPAEVSLRRTQGSATAVLLLADSIFNKFMYERIRQRLPSETLITFFQHPNSAERARPWYKAWGLEEAGYDVVFQFDLMHGFPPNLTIDDHRHETGLLVSWLGDRFEHLIWCNRIPVPPGFKKGVPASEKGPSTIAQTIDNPTIQAMNENLRRIMGEQEVELLDLYSVVAGRQHEYQPWDNMHLTPVAWNLAADLVADAILRRLGNP